MIVGVQLLPCFGMDGPNVNECFQKKLGEELQLKGKMLISIGKCPLHVFSNALLEGLKSLLPNIDLNQFAIDLHNFPNIFQTEQKSFLIWKQKRTPLSKR